VLPFFKKSENYNGCNRGDNRDGVKSGDRGDKDGVKSNDRGQEDPSCPHHGRGGPLHVRQGFVQHGFFLHGMVARVRWLRGGGHPLQNVYEEAE
jgi:hypothetical protein